MAYEDDRQPAVLKIDPHMLCIGNIYTNGKVEVRLLRVCPEHVLISTLPIKRKSFVRLSYFCENFVESVK